MFAWYGFYMYVKVSVLAGAKKETVTVISENRLAMTVKEKAQQNMANRRVVALVAAHFKKPLHKVRLVSGHHSPSKILSVD